MENHAPSPTRFDWLAAPPSSRGTLQRCTKHKQQHAMLTVTRDDHQSDVLSILQHARVPATEDDPSDHVDDVHALESSTRCLAPEGSPSDDRRTAGVTSSRQGSVAFNPYGDMFLLLLLSAF